MTDHETTVLAARLHTLADDLTPPLDVVGQVRTARSRHQKQRRGRIAVLAVATATAAVVVGTTAAADLLAGPTERGQVAVPSTPAPTTTEAAPTTPPPAETTGLPAGWEPRTFEGVGLAVPPGARMADTLDMRPVDSFMDGPSLTWNGPALGGGEFAQVKVEVVGTYEGGMTPADGGEWFTVPGAESAYGGIDPWTGAEESGPAVASHTLWMQILAGDRQILVSGTFPSGAAGEQMARDVIASLTVTPGIAGPDPVDVHQPSTEWETFTVQGISFSVPPGSSAPEHRTDSSLTWYGPPVGGEPTILGLDIMPLIPGQTVGDGYRPTTVPGADQAWLSTDVGTINPGQATFNVWIQDEGRNINVGGTLPLDPAAEETMRRVIASIVVP